MSPLISLLVGVVVVLVITAATAYFVAQEFAYVAVDRSQLSSRAAAGDPKATRTLDITRRTSFMLSGAQLGITITGLLVGYAAEPMIGAAIGDLVSGGARTALAMGVGSVIALLFSTLVQMLLGELFPKNYAISRSAAVADALSPSTKLYLTVFGPVIWVFDKAAELLLRVLRIEPVHDVESAVSATDLERVVADSRASGTLPEDLGFIIDRIIDFPRRDVEHAMVPRVRVGIVRETDTIAQVRHLMATGHTRYPILDRHDNVAGIAQLVDVLDSDPGSTARITTIAREPLFLPTFMPLPDAHDQLVEHRQELACVLDEFGSFVGIVTVEDLVEEIVGDLVDEHDVDLDASDDVLVMGGDTPVDEVERRIGHKLPAGDFETLSGLILHELGDLPIVGQVIELRLEPTISERTLHEDAPTRVVAFEVLALERHVPSRVRIALTAEEGEQE